MARPIVLSNGELHVGLNKYGLVHDFYYPYVGLENHAAANGLRHKVGIYVDGGLHWLDDGTWDVTLTYPHNSLIGHIVANNDSIRVSLEFDDFVDAHQSAFLRNIQIINNADHEREIKLYLHQVLVISNSHASDTVQYLPDMPAIMHYKGRRVFIVSGEHNDDRPFDQFSTGIYGIENHAGTYKDAEDGQLSENPVEHGSVDSVLGFVVVLKAHDSSRVHYWITAGKSIHEAMVMHERIKEEGLTHRLLITHDWWQRWLEPAYNCTAHLPEEYKKPLIESLLILKSHMDKRGAIVASTDTAMLNYFRDAYAYCWPRDAAYALWPLIRMGYKDEALHFFNFCKRALHEDGYLMQKYQADGAVGSSWHSYTHEDGIQAPPIQEDETAGVLFMIMQYFHHNNDARALREYYQSLIKPMANFLASCVDQDGLPKPSYDLWEETYMTSTYTTSVVFAGLQSAIHLAEKLEESEDAIRWSSVATEMQSAARKYLYNADRNYFYHGFTRSHDGAMQMRDKIDLSSFYGAFMFGLFDNNGDEVKAAHDTLKKTFLSDGNVGGLPRYEHDTYHAVDPAGMGNPWFITTLWLAQYYMDQDNHTEAKKYVDWVLERRTPSGVLSEQINPYTNEFLSVAPLAWSHAEVINTLLDLVIDAPNIPEELAS